MKLRIPILLLWLAVVASAGADQTIENVQQALKDQGYYYGAVDGQKNPDTVAAIRRYQIRNGLQVTGDLNDETMRSIQSGAGSAQQSPAATLPPASAQQPASSPDSSDLRDNAAHQNGTNVAPAPAYVPGNSDQGPVTGQPIPSATGLFGGTPYETAPVEVQRRVISDAQRILTHRGLFNGTIDGTYGPGLEFSLRAYQSRAGIPRTGRLDLETLAALQLLPGAHAPVFIPRRSVNPPEQPVRGEWIKP